MGYELLEVFLWFLTFFLLTTVKNILTIYKVVLGQHVNYNKSSISFSRNMVDDTIHPICEQLGVVATSDYGTYLGLPSSIDRKKTNIFIYIRDKVWKRIQGWH